MARVVHAIQCIVCPIGCGGEVTVEDGSVAQHQLAVAVRPRLDRQAQVADVLFGKAGVQINYQLLFLIA